jgi:RimJ/RimL family protein N-acetyltransferase
MIEPIGNDAAPALQQLFERCAEFFQLVEGRFPPPDTALKELEFTMPGKTTVNFGVYEDGRLIAFAGLLRDYPKAPEWWLGLMILDPDKRGRGFGAAVHQEIVEWILAQGATVLWIGVQVQNENAQRFWKRIGYVERERQMWTAPSGLESETILLTYALLPAGGEKVPRSGG